jgi:hypothetical protein
VEDFDFQAGKRYPPRGIWISKLENVILQGGFGFPSWKTLSSKGDFDFQAGKRFPPKGIWISKLENGFLLKKISKTGFIHQFYTRIF